MHANLLRRFGKAKSGLKKIRMMHLRGILIIQSKDGTRNGINRGYDHHTRLTKLMNGNVGLLNLCCCLIHPDGRNAAYLEHRKARS